MASTCPGVKPFACVMGTGAPGWDGVIWQTRSPNSWTGASPQPGHTLCAHSGLLGQAPGLRGASARSEGGSAHDCSQ